MGPNLVGMKFAANVAGGFEGFAKKCIVWVGKKNDPGFSGGCTVG